MNPESLHHKPALSRFERLLKQDKTIVIAALVIVNLAAWAWLLAGAGMNMNGMEMTRHSMMGMEITDASSWSLPYAILMFFMWWIMMIAMMMPSASSVILLAAGINRRSAPGAKPFGTSAAFAAGYFASWAGFSILAVAAQWALRESGLINAVLQSNERWLSAAILITAGAWQFTPLKAACLRHCRGPVDFLTRHRREGNTGALFLGAIHGQYCLGCCWFLMALLFVGGVMNLIWIAGLTIYIWVERTMPGGQVLARIMGATLVLWGASLLG